jgi:Flp pilus assembly protein TadG
MARRPFWKDERGATAVEFAIIANVFIVFVMVIAYFGIMLFNTASLDWAVNDAVRIASVDSSADQTAISNAINARLSEFGLSNASVTYTKETINSIQTGHIQASYVQTYSIPFLRTFDMTYSSQAYVPVGS